VPGLALGHAASYVVATAAGLVLLRRKLGSLDGRRVGRTIGRAVPAAALTAIVAWLVAAAVAEVVDTDLVLWRFVQVGLAVAAGVGIYLATALRSGIEEVDEVVGAVRRRFR
jgi:putative peptidoglycan lipid II flippase